MSRVHIRAERRGLRGWISVPVRVSGKNIDDRNFSEDTDAIVVNAHGGLFCLRQPVKIRAEIVLTNLVTQEVLECRVVTLNDPPDKGVRVGIEFLSPSPDFWGVEFPPDDRQSD